jgi:hypothetical protein
MSTRAIADSFSSEYDAAGETILEAVAGFVQQTLDFGFLIPSEAVVGS